MFRRLFVIAGVITALVATSLGTAGAAGVPPEQWAPKFCAAIQTYETTISAQGDAMTTALEGTTDLKRARNQIVSFLAKMVAVANTTTRKVAQAGAPSSPNGAKIEALFVSGLKSTSKLFAKAKASAAKLPTKNIEAFKTQGTKLGQDLTHAGDELGQSFSGIGQLDRGKQLEAAVKAAPECAFLT